MSTLWVKDGSSAPGDERIRAREWFAGALFNVAVDDWTMVPYRPYGSGVCAESYARLPWDEHDNGELANRSGDESGSRAQTSPILPRFRRRSRPSQWPAKIREAETPPTS